MSTVRLYFNHTDSIGWFRRCEYCYFERATLQLFFKITNDRGIFNYVCYKCGHLQFQHSRNYFLSKTREVLDNLN